METETLCGAPAKAGTGSCVREAYHKGDHSQLRDLRTARQSRGATWAQKGRGDSNPRCTSCHRNPQAGDFAPKLSPRYLAELCVECNDESAAGS